MIKCPVCAQVKRAYKKLSFFNSFNFFLEENFTVLKVKFVVCVQYNRIFAYCIPTLCVLRKIFKKTEYCIPKRGGGVTLLDGEGTFHGIFLFW